MYKRLIAFILCVTLAVSLAPAVNALPIQVERQSVDRCCETLRVNPLDVNYVRPDYDGKLIDLTPQRVADTFAYLDAHYVQNYPEQALHVYTGTHEDRANLLKLAQVITEGCTTDRRKADAIGSWLSRNINYDVNTSAYASDTFYRREGNCLSYANLMMFLLRSLGIPAVVGDGWRGDMKTSTVELFNYEGHAWCFVYLDGQWVLYDPLWIEGGTTDREYMAEWIYFDTVEFVTPVTDGDNLPPRTNELPMPYWTNGNYYLFSNAFPTGTGTLSYFVNNQAYIFVSNQCEPEGSQDGRLYIDGRDKSDMVMGELYRDGWVSYGEYHNDRSMAHTYAFPNGMMPDGYTMEFDNKLWYMSYDSAVPILMDEGDYWIQDGLVTMAPGYSGPWLGLRWQDGCFESSIGEVFLEYENCTPEVATIDDSGNITCHAEGYAEFRFMLQRRDRNGNITLMGSALTQIFVSTEDRTPDYRDLGNHTHDMVYSHSIDATCEGWGMDIYQCTGCVHTEERYTTEPLGHEHQAVGTIDPTCTDYGYVVYECIRCGDSYNSAEIDMLGHDYVRSVFADPTCTEAGYGYYRCSRCQDERVEADTPALGHSYVDGTCTRCGAADESVISGSCGENLTWVLSEDGTLTISGTGAMYDFEYMETPWYGYFGDISAVVIQDGVTRIGNNAFREGVNITAVSLSDTITEIGAWSFMGAEKLTGIVLPQNLRTLEQEAFLNCVSLEEIELPGTLTFFDGPFAGCTSLKRAVIHGDPNIPSFMMGSTPFRFCTSLEAIEVDEDHFCLLSIDGVLYQRSGEELILMQYPGGKQDTVYELAPKTCQIFQMAMEDVDALEELIIPGTVQILDEYALMSCDNLHTIRFEGDAPQFGAEVFWGVTATVYYPSGNATWTADVMQDYSGTITWVPVDDVPDNYCGENVTWNLENGTLTISGAGAMTSAPWLQAHRDEIQTVVIEEGVTAIADYAFRDCVNLVSVSFPAGMNPAAVRPQTAKMGATLKTIGEGAFLNCSGLTEITLPGSVTDIGDGAFMYCTGLEQITFTGDAPTLGEGCFGEVEATVTYPEDNDTWSEEVLKDYGGEIVWKEERMNYAKFTSISTSLGGNIAMNFYVELSEDLISDPDAYVQFTFGGKTIHVPLSEGVASGNNIYRFACPITSKNMTDDITAQVYNAAGPVGTSKTMSVDTYCNWVIENVKDEKTVNLMKAMLNYGASAQMLFNYRTDDLANAALSAADKTFGKVDASAFAHSRVGEEDGIKPVSYTLLLDSETTVRCYFQLTGSKTIDQFTFKVDGIEVTPTYKDGYYYIEKANIAAHRLDDMHTFTCGNITITYGGLSYVNQVMTYYTSGTTFDMASALYAYSKAAESYIG